MKLSHRDIVRVGVDLAKSVAQVHGVALDGRVIVARQLPRRELLDWCLKLEPGCTVAMEACSSAHLLARQLNAAGLQARLISPSFVAPYRLTGVTGKNDATDAEAICEAASRPRMRYVPAKTLDQQSWLAIHRLREGYVKDHSAWVNRMRAVLFEFGVDVPKAIYRFAENMNDALTAHADELPSMIQEAANRHVEQFAHLEKAIEWCDEQINRHLQVDMNAQRALTVRGIGRLSASALAASVGDLSQFNNARQFSAWLGLVPSQRSTGGKQRLGKITKRGDSYLRSLMVLGAKSVIAKKPKSQDRVYDWAMQLRERIGWRKATVALANKNARLLWGTLNHWDSPGRRPSQFDSSRKLSRLIRDKPAA